MKPNYVTIPLITILVALLGSFFTFLGLEAWYGGLVLPVWTPSGTLIGVVWTILYVLAAISVLIVWNKLLHDNRFMIIIALFLANAFLNVFWSYLFFSVHFLGSTIFVSGFLALTVVVLIILIWSKNRYAAYLLLPYAAWVIFATYLNYVIWLMN